MFIYIVIYLYTFLFNTYFIRFYSLCISILMCIVLYYFKFYFYILSTVSQNKGKTMVKNTALTKLMSGEKVRATSWDKNKFISINKDGQIVDDNAKLYNIVTAKEKNWEIYKEPTAEATTNNAELVAMIKALTEQVANLQDTVKHQEVKVNNDIDSSDIADEVTQSLDTVVKQAIQDNMPQEEKTHEETVKIFYGVSSLKDVRDLFKEELLNSNSKRDTMLTVTKFIPYCWMGGRKIKTVARYYADMRNVIKDVDDEYRDLALELFSVPSDVYERIKKVDTEKVLDNLEDKEVFDATQIQNVISALKAQIVNNDIPIAKQQTLEQARAYLYASYLALVTGRRSVEILKSLEIVKVGKEWIYRGISKKGVDDSEIKAYALDDDFEFLAGLIKQLRADIDCTGLKNTEVNSKYNHIFNRSFKRLTGLNYTFHDAREIYAELVYIKFGKKNGSDREEINFKSDVLGHEINKDRLVATEHYMTKKGE